MDILLGIIAVVIPAASAYLALQFAKSVLPFVDNLPGVVKQIVAVAVAFVFAKLSALFGVPFPAELSGLADPSIVAGILSGFASWFVHKVFSPKS